MRSRTLLSGAALVLFATLGIWLWVFAPSIANALSLTLACLILLYLYVVRLVVPLVKANKSQFSVFDLSAFVLAASLLVAHRRTPDALAALSAWPCTTLMFFLHSRNSPSAVGTRRKLFWAHVGFFVLAMIFSALVLFWLAAQWPSYYDDRPFEPPVFTYMLAPAVLLMMTIQADLAVDYLHPSLVAGVLVSIAVAFVAAAITSWATSAATHKLCERSESSVNPRCRTWQQNK